MSEQHTSSNTSPEKKKASNHPGNTLARAKENNLLISVWVHRWGWTSNQIIQRLLNVKNIRPADDFVKKGLLKKIDSTSAFGERHAYVLTQDGLYLAGQFFCEKDFDVPPYKLHRTRKLPFTFFPHDMQVQHVFIDNFPQPIKDLLNRLQDWTTGVELQKEQEKNNNVSFDMCINNNEILSLYEVEISEKTKEDLAQWVYARAKFLNEVDPNTKKELVLWTPHDRIIRNYKAAFSGKIYPAKFSKELNKYVIRTDHEPIRTDLSKIRFVKAIKDPSRKSGGYIKDMNQGRKYPIIEGL